MKMYQQSLMYMLIQMLAPLPGKIVNEEAINYGKWAYRSITEDKIRLRRNSTNFCR